MIESSSTIDDIRNVVGEARARGDRIALVPTMGALHAGHLAHVRRARDIADTVVVSIFVNPLQFAPGEDRDRYPRTPGADSVALAEAGADHIFSPSTAEMYPDGAASTRVEAGEVGSRYEGAARPGHFDGVLTVVAKLFNIVQPDVATFGQKDAQQAFLVARMVRDLNLSVAIEIIPTVREPDGLALSSRNRYLDSRQRSAALALSRALAAAAVEAQHGVRAALDAGRVVVAVEPAVRLDYLVAVDPVTFLEVGDDLRGTAMLLVAANVGETRLIDNDTITID